MADDDARCLAAAGQPRRRAVADLEPHQLAAAALERGLDALARDPLLVAVAVGAEVDVETVAERVRMKCPPANWSDGIVSA